MLLDSTGKSITVVLAGAKATTDCPITSFYIDHTDAGGTPGSHDAATNGVTAVTAVSSPAASTQRQVKMITVYNLDTAAVTVYTILLNGATSRIMNKSTLAVGESLIYQNEIGFRISQPTLPLFLQSSDLNIEAVTKYLNVNTRFMDTLGTTYGYKVADGKPRISNTPYNYDIAEGNISNHAIWSKLGYNGALVAATEADVWSKAGLYAFPTTASTMRIVSSSAGDEDMGIIIKSGTSTGGSTTTLIDTTGGVDFGAVVAVEVGDCILLDPANEGGRTPEWGYVTTVAAQTLTVAGGFSSGGTGSGRTYKVVDKVLAALPRTGAQCWKVEYLDANYNAYTELGVFDGNAQVSTVGTMWRINSFRVIATGTGNVPVGNLTLENAGGTDYAYITLGFTRARGGFYTVPLGKTLYTTTIIAGYAHGHTQPHYCRIYIRANCEVSTGFNMGSIFYPYAETISVGGSIPQEFTFPMKFPAKTDIKISARADYTGIVTVTARGWLE